MLSTTRAFVKAGPLCTRTSRRCIRSAPGLGVASTVTISSAIIEDHRELRECYNEVVRSTDREHQQRWGNQFTWELARHSVGEELVVHPVLDKHLGSVGKQMAETDRKDHHEVSGE